MKNMRNGFYRFMAGRYGNDSFNNFLLVFSFIFLIINFVLKLNIISILVEVLLIYMLYRSFSKNFVKRHAENNFFIKLKYLFHKRYLLIKKQISDFKHRYYMCPNCHQIVRVPKGKGKVIIKCAKCHNEFERRR